MSPSIVFVPNIGFRVGETQVLGRRTSTRIAAGSVTVVAAAVSTGASQILVEWDSPEGVLLNARPELSFELSIASRVVHPLSHVTPIRLNAGYARMLLSFDQGWLRTTSARLRVRHGEESVWLPIELVPPRVPATQLVTKCVVSDVVMRATAIADYLGEMWIELRGSSLDPRLRITELGGDCPVRLPDPLSPPIERDLVAEDMTIRIDGQRVALVRQHAHLPDVTPPGTFSMIASFRSPGARGSLVLEIPSIALSDELGVQRRRSGPWTLDISAS